MRPRNTRVAPGGRQQGFGLGGVSGMRYASLYPVYCSPPKSPRSPRSHKRKRRILSSHCTRRAPGSRSEPLKEVAKRIESESESESENDDDDDDDDDD